MQTFLEEEPLQSTKELFDRETSHLYQLIPFSKKLGHLISRWFRGTERKVFINGTHSECDPLLLSLSVDAEPDRFPLYTTSQFPISNISYMSKFSRLPRQDLCLPGKDCICSIDIANILPSFLKSVRNTSIPIPPSDENWQARNRIIDHDIIEREEWAQNTLAYETMRASALKEVEGDLPSDHLETKYSKEIYKDIRNLEWMVVEKLVEEMKKKNCTMKVIQRYEEMKKELESTVADVWDNIREELKKKKSLKSSNVVVTDKEVIAVYRVKVKEQLNKYRNHFYSTSYQSSGSSVCDGCSFKDRKYVRPQTRVFLNGAVMRCFIGNTENRRCHGYKCLG